LYISLTAKSLTLLNYCGILQLLTNSSGVAYENESNYFQSQNKYSLVLLDDVKLFSATSTKNLGVIIDNSLSWKPHLNQLISKINRNAAVIRRIRSKIDAKTALLLYDSMIQSHISYCTIIWAVISNIKLKNIHIIQKRVLRLIVQSSKRAPSKPIFKKLQS